MPQKTKPKQSRTSNTLIVELGDDGILRRILERLAEADAIPGEKPNLSRVIRRLIREEGQRLID